VGVKSASCITIDGGKLIVINLIREKYNSLDAVPVYHSTCMDTPKLSPGDLAPFVVKNGAADYTGATIIAIVNNEGYLSYLNIREPVILSGTFTYDDLPDISFDVATVWKQSIAIAYS